jgi:hypothetical protein
MKQSAQAEREQNFASEFYLEWPEGSSNEVFHKLIGRARSMYKVQFESALRSEVMPVDQGGGVATPMIKDGQLQFVRRDDYDELKELGLLKPGEDQWVRDPVTGEKQILYVRMPAPAHQEIHVSRAVLGDELRRSPIGSFHRGSSTHGRACDAATWTAPL